MKTARAFKTNIRFYFTNLYSVGIIFINYLSGVNKWIKIKNIG